MLSKKKKLTNEDGSEASIRVPQNSDKFGKNPINSAKFRKKKKMEIKIFSRNFFDFLEFFKTFFVILFNFFTDFLADFFSGFFS